MLSVFFTVGFSVWFLFLFRWGGGFASLTMGFCVCMFICLYVYTFICLYVYTFICLYVYMFYPFPFPFPFPFPQPVSPTTRDDPYYKGGSLLQGRIPTTREDPYYKGGSLLEGAIPTTRGIPTTREIILTQMCISRVLKSPQPEFGS